MKGKILSLEFENQDLSSSLQNVSNKSQFKKVLENKNEMGYSEDDIKKLDSLKVFSKILIHGKNHPLRSLLFVNI